MLNVPKLTDSDVSNFERDGYLIVRGAFPSDQMNSIASWTDELLAMPEEPGKHWVYHEPSLKADGDDLVSRIENIGPYHAGFLELSEALKGPVSQLLGEEAVLFKEKINFKMPGADGFKPHQDSQAGWDRYADFFISVLVTIDDATEENGCLQICAGHHKQGLYTSWQPLTEEDMVDMEFVSVPTNPGGLIFFDCYTPHQSQPNLSDKIRRIYFATFNRLSAGDHLEQYYADKFASYPPDIERQPNKEYVYRV